MIKLSDREKEVIDLICTGIMNKEAAVVLNISTKGVKFHLTNIYKKTGVKNRYELILKFKNEFDIQKQ